MPFSWDQIIPGHQQTFKQKIIALYIDENRRLDGAGGVRDYMKEHYNFDKRSFSVFLFCSHQDQLTSLKCLYLSPRIPEMGYQEK